MGRLVVDGMNVIGARPTGWWRDRDGAVRTLLARLQRLADVSSDEVVLVLDGRPLPDLPEGDHGGVRVLYATRAGGDAADDRIRDVATASAGVPVVVVTSDRALAADVEARGAEVRGATALIRQLEALE